MTFIAGNVVRLKSGNGPIMVVERLNEEGDCVCTWFDGEHKSQYGVYPSCVLIEHVRRSEPGVISARMLSR